MHRGVSADRWWCRSPVIGFSRYRSVITSSLSEQAHESKASTDCLYLASVDVNARVTTAALSADGTTGDESIFGAGGEDPNRKPEDVAAAVAGWVARGGSFMNYCTHLVSMQPDVNSVCLVANTCGHASV